MKESKEITVRTKYVDYIMPKKFWGFTVGYEISPEFIQYNKESCDIWEKLKKRPEAVRRAYVECQMLCAQTRMMASSGRSTGPIPMVDFELTFKDYL